MTDPKTCPRCGAPIRPDETPAGLCAACLMKMGLDSRSGAAEVVLTESERAERPPAPTIAELAPHFPELEIVELVGRGGMGAVYRAKQRSLDRDVALKVLTVGTGDATFADRFQREARTLATLSHPAITAVFDFGQRGPWSFLAMEFVEGASLRQMLRARELGARESLAIVSQMCDALQYAHDKGVVHRDIKPENVLVTRDGRVKLLDFGLAKLVGTAQRDNLTQARQVMGTPHYMAPEQWEKPLTVDHRADIYAMGVVFYELLTGELPIGRFAPPSHKVAVDVRLDDVVLRSLEKEPDRRYQHASEVKDEVAGISATPGGAPPVVPLEPKRKSSSRKWIVAGSAIGCLLLLLFPAGFLAYVVLARGRVATGQKSQLEYVQQQRLGETAEKLRSDNVIDAREAELLALEIEIAQLTEQMSGLKPQHSTFRMLSEQLDAKRARRDELQQLGVKGNVGMTPETEVPQATQPPDRAANYAYVNAYLNSRPDSLAIPAEVAGKLGVPADRVAELNRDLQHVWSSYLHWEADGLVLTWIGADAIRVEVAPGHSPPDHLMERAEKAIARATEGVVTNGIEHPSQVLPRFVEKQLRFAPGDWVKFEVSMDDSRATVNRFEYRGRTEPWIVEAAFESPPSAAAQRIWDRALAERDAQPK